MLPYENYRPTLEIDLTRGFLPAEDPVARLPEGFEKWEHIADNLHGLMLGGRLREVISELPAVDFSRLESRGEWERAMQLLSVFGNAYVWCNDTEVTVIPHSLAVPWAVAADEVGRPMIITHGSIILNNWRRLDPNAPLDISNLQPLILFSGSLDEAWFYMVTIAIEIEGVTIMPLLLDLLTAVAEDRPGDVLRGLQSLKTGLKRITSCLNRMFEKCDPYIFYHRIRPFFAGWKSPGILYEGVFDAPRKFEGGSAAQSALIQSVDACLGIRHESEKTGPYLMEMRNYMSPEHRGVVEYLESAADLEGYVNDFADPMPQLCREYNQCIEQLTSFRKIHLGMSVHYILKQGPQQNDGQGTGGTTFVPFLKKAMEESSQCQVPEHEPAHKK